MSTISRIALALTILTGLSAAVGLAAAPPAAKPKPRITISRETTYLTAPLRPDGYVDYVGALNAELSRGVTPENNAVVPLLRAFGPKAVDEKQREAFFKMLGIPVPPQEGHYFIYLDQYILRVHEAENHPDTDYWAQQSKEASAQLEQAQVRPWSKEEFPTINGWLEANREPMERIAEAARRPRCYVPLVSSSEPPLLMVSLSLISPWHGGPRALQARAMLRLHDGKLDTAWQDLLSCHRLARHAGQGPMLVDGLASFAIERLALQGDAALAHYGHPSVAKIGQMKAELAGLPSTPKMADRFDHGERFFSLDLVAAFARKGVSHMGDLTKSGRFTDKPSGFFEGIALGCLDAMIDWDEPLRMENQWCDRMAAAARKPTHAERVATTADLEKDVKALAAGIKDPERIAERFLERMPPQAAGHWIGDVLVALELPWLDGLLNMEDRRDAETALRDVALDLAAYRADHGKYPERLADLKPNYRTETKDPFSSGDLIYRPAADGFLLYSVGPNGKDDGGRNRNDYSGDESPPGASEWDDLAIRMPVSPPKR
jgi:hypothetical protein